MEELIHLLEEKLRLLREVREETGRQGGFIAQQDSESLLKSAEARQALMAAIDALDARMKGLPRQGGAIARLEADIVAELKAIIRKDDENRNNAGEQASLLISGIRESNTARTLKAYQAPAGVGCIYVNKKG